MTNTISQYRSPFGDPSTDHDTPDALCLARVNFDKPMLATIAEYAAGAVTLIDAGFAQPAFFQARQLAELSLKGLIGPNHPWGHDLEKLLKVLEDQNHDLFTGTDAEQWLVLAFVRDLHRVDPGGDEGRYPVSHGLPALDKCCCADPVILREHVLRLHSYVEPRVSW